MPIVERKKGRKWLCRRKQKLFFTAFSRKLRRAHNDFSCFMITMRKYFFRVFAVET